MTIATIVSAVLAIPTTVVAVYPFVKDHQAQATKQPAHHQYDGTVAYVASHWESWDKRGFDPRDMNSPASPITYRYAGHYKDSNGDRNPANDMCSIQLYANPSGSTEYGGPSGFVYVQPGTADHPEGAALYNPQSPDAVYRMQLKYGQYVPPQCWPGDGAQNNDVRYPHSFAEYL